MVSETVKYPIGRFERTKDVSPKALTEAISILQIFPEQIKQYTYNLSDETLEDGLNNGTKQDNSPASNPSDLVGRTFLMKPAEDGTRWRARIVQATEDHETEVDKERLKFEVSINDDEFEDIVSHHDVSEHIEHDEDTDALWKFKRITAHSGPLEPNDPHCNGSSHNVMVEWENGEITEEPLKTVSATDPVTCATCTKENDPLDTPGWKQCKKTAHRHKKCLRMVNQAKLRSCNSARKCMFGYEIPKNCKDALRLDEQNGNTK